MIAWMELVALLTNLIRRGIVRAVKYEVQSILLHSIYYYFLFKKAKYFLVLLSLSIVKVMIKRSGRILQHITANLVCWPALWVGNMVPPTTT